MSVVDTPGNLERSICAKFSGTTATPWHVLLGSIASIMTAISGLIVALRKALQLNLCSRKPLDAETLR